MLPCRPGGDGSLLLGTQAPKAHCGFGCRSWGCAQVPKMEDLAMGKNRHQSWELISLGSLALPGVKPRLWSWQPWPCPLVTAPFSDLVELSEGWPLMSGDLGAFGGGLGSIMFSDWHLGRPPMARALQSDQVNLSAQAGTSGPYPGRFVLPGHQPLRVTGPREHIIPNLPISLHLLTRLTGWLPNAPQGSWESSGGACHVLMSKVSQQSLSFYITDSCPDPTRAVTSTSSTYLPLDTAPRAGAPKVPGCGAVCPGISPLSGHMLLEGFQGRTVLGLSAPAEFSVN